MIKHLFTSMPMFVCGICTVFVILRWHECRTKAMAWFTAFMTAATGLYVCHYLYFNHEAAPVIDTFYSLCNLLVYPLYFIYLSRLAVGGHQPKLPRPGLLLMPSFVVTAAIGILYMAMDAAACDRFVEQWLFHGQWQGLQGLALAQAILHVAAKVLFALQIIPVLVVGRRMIKQHDRYVIDNYADIDGKTLSSIQTLLIVLMVTSAVSFTANVIGRQKFVDAIWMLAVPSAAFSVLLFAVAYVGLSLSNPIATDMALAEAPLQQADPPQEASSAAAASMEPEESMVTKNRINEIKDEIIKLLNDEQLYLQHDLRISHLSERLNTNRYYIQQALNMELGCTFSDLVNRLRIEYAVKLIESTPGMPVTEVAERSGYRSLASFYRNFKLIKGCVPKDLTSDEG